MAKKTTTVSLGILTAVLMGMLLLRWQGYNPWGSYAAVLKYSLGSSFAIGVTLERTAIVAMVALAATTTFSSGASNLGMFGQILTGEIIATAIGVYAPLPDFLLLPTMLVASAFGGALMSLIAGLLRKYFGMNEFITTLMFNFILNYFTEYLVNVPMRDPEMSWPMSKVVASAGVMPRLFGFLDGSVLFAIAVLSVSYIFWNHTKLGYEMRMNGKNPLFAKYGGCDADGNFLKAMALSGAYNGLAGCLLIVGSGQQNRFVPGMGENYANEGLMIAIVANNHVLAVALYALVFSILNAGATGMQLETSVPLEFITMLIGLTVMSVVSIREYSTTFINNAKAFLENRKINNQR